ncbi:hypothetical protein Krac_10255 [Ktedonobacter racemifer DSM 44963]|uniref:Uncharacterized protein n=1 Tax=Ktedonobacter racemifer DSM 44963 TaxID=485913 RepID=D6TG56_KTERA|nr:hypothetical protein Krac_10255 [Ktedonobacter racemifer DSM 44963]
MTGTTLTNSNRFHSGNTYGIKECFTVQGQKEELPYSVVVERAIVEIPEKICFLAIW